MQSKLNVIALISGGKDSLFSILHCVANGHNVVALANLFPPASHPSKQSSEVHVDRSPNTTQSGEDEEDLNSYMYQTAGYGVIPLYAEALGLPLYRQEITGTAINTDKTYAPSSLDGGDDDETEALIPLIRKVMAAHPAANALSSGAILSDYQRTRVESVAIRLGLVPLSFLWHYPDLPPGLQTSLLDDMAAVGQEAMIIKVASGGLDESFLWRNVADETVKMRMVKCMERFGGAGNGAVLGEGGEYETLALNGPSPVWKKRIVVEEHDMQTVMGGGGMVSLKIKSARLLSRGEGLRGEASIADLRIPELLDKEFVSVREGLENKAWPSQGHVGEGDELTSSPHTPRLAPVHSRTARTWTIANLTAPEAGDRAEVQMGAIAEKLIKELKAFQAVESVIPEDVVFATILLRSMTDFAAVNAVYANIFTRPNPPARVTVACREALAETVRIMVSFVIDLGRRGARQGLHVQSRSYWAPANIGPYSQAIAIPVDTEQEYGLMLVYVAGQIPLIPASMELASTESLDAGINPMAVFRTQALLSLQHLWRIGRATDVNWWTGGIAFIAGNHNIQIRALTAWRIWESMHDPGVLKDEFEEEDDRNLDAWDRIYGGLWIPGATGRTDVRHQLPSYEDTVVGEGPLAAYPVPSFFAVQVDELPKDAEIEWQSLGVANGRVYVNEHVDERMITKSCSFGDHRMTVLYYSILPTRSLDELHQTVMEILDDEGPDRGNGSHVTIYTRYTPSCQNLCAQIIPCRSVWGSNGRRLAAGVVVRRDGDSLSHGVQVIN
jgi:diphthine-ammonia ligase